MPRQLSYFQHECGGVHRLAGSIERRDLLRPLREAVSDERVALTREQTLTEAVQPLR